MKDYLEYRVDDPPFTTSMTESWVNKHTPDEDSVIEAITQNAASLTLQESATASNIPFKHNMRPPRFTGSYDMGGVHTYTSLPLNSFVPSYPWASSHVSIPLPPASIQNTHTPASAMNSARTNVRFATGTSFSTHSETHPSLLGAVGPSQNANEIDSWIDALEVGTPNLKRTMM